MADLMSLTPETQTDVEDITKMVCREMSPSYPMAMVMRCQIGSYEKEIDREYFRLDSFGATWSRAYQMWERRQEMKLGVYQ